MRKFSEAIDSLKNGDVDWKEKVGSVTAAAGAKLGQAREAAKAGLEAAKASENGQKFLEATAAAGQRVGQARAAAGQRIETFKASENGQKIFEAAAAAGAKLGEVRGPGVGAFIGRGQVRTRRGRAARIALPSSVGAGMPPH